eukprot:c24867_g1_i1 orf=246-3212(+)
MAGTTWPKWMVINLLGILLQSTGLVLFVFGFFPVKPALMGNSGMESLNFDCSESAQYVTASDKTTSSFLEKLEVRPQFNRVVLMVIDGLPAEFLLGRDGLAPSRETAAAMPFTQELLFRKEAIGFHANAAPPTVTMPRLKAMTSGAIAGFLDVAFNFNTQAMLDDNLIGQLERLGWKIAMFGDETWLRLFPNSFIRQDGVSSFYVKDTIQVDQNVTRHLDDELARFDWDLLILHYLGLDHVGHLGGRSSPLMARKLQEMDAVIEQLHAALIENKSKFADRETLLMVVSDHGMTHGGNHGGASFEERDALALFIHNRAFSDSDCDKASQVDLVPTLAMLLGVPIPKNSVGVLLLQLFDTLTATEKLRALEVNSWQLIKLLKVRSPKSPCIRSICSGEALDSDLQENNGNKEIMEFCKLFRVAKQLHENWRDSPCNREDSSCGPADWEVVSVAYLSFLHAASDWLARGTTEKDALLIYNGGFLVFLSSVLFLTVFAATNTEFCDASKNKRELWNFKPENWIAFAGVCGHALSFNSSSLVEEEQFTLHFLVVTLWCLFARKICQKRWCHEPVLCQSFKAWWNLLPSLRRCMKEGKNADGDAFETRDPSACDRTMLAQAVAIILILITARVLRGWHRSGVNWAHLPDVAKWLEKMGPSTLLATQLVSLIVVTIISCWLVLEQAPWVLMQRVVAGTFLLAAFLIAWYKARTWGGTGSLVDGISIKIAQLVYIVLGGTTLTVLLFTPVFVCSSVTRRQGSILMSNYSFLKVESARGHQMCLNFIGKVFISCWCLLQLLLQQPVNSVPVLLLLLQLISCLVFFNLSGSTLDSWLKVLTLYCMGSSGHFGMGNTNTLATVDVAGAYIGLSQHSIFLSGLLAFIITYAAPLLYMLGALILISLAKFDANAKGDGNGRERWLLEAIALPCTVPLVLTSVVLVSFTLVMLLMQGHLFIWSVFSPKYIYVCFTVLSTYWGVILNALVSLYVYVILCKFLR